MQVSFSAMSSCWATWLAVTMHGRLQIDVSLDNLLIIYHAFQLFFRFYLRPLGKYRLDATLTISTNFIAFWNSV